MSLSNVGFKHTQIESALNDTTQYGGDLIDALDWLCLNLNNGRCFTIYYKKYMNNGYYILNIVIAYLRQY